MTALKPEVTRWQRPLAFTRILLTEVVIALCEFISGSLNTMKPLHKAQAFMIVFNRYWY